MRNGSQLRYWLVGLLFVLSIIPQLLMLPILGSINLLFLIAVWVILCAFTLFGPKPLAAAIAVLGAIAMAIPPIPNYAFPDNSGTLRLGFIGWENVAHALYGTIFFFVFYLVIFELAAFLTERPRLELR